MTRSGPVAMKTSTPARAADLPLEYNAVDILDRNVARHPQKTALYTGDGEFSFEAVATATNQVANALRGMDVRMGDSVAILCLDTAEWVAAFFGTLRCGGVAVGMSTLLTSEEIGFILNNSRARVAVVHAALLAGLEEARSGCPFLEHVIVVGGPADEGDLTFDQWTAGAATTSETTLTHRNDFATLNYSSGTTGKPKGILHAHKDLVLTAELWGARTLGLAESDRTFSLAKLFFTFGLGGNLLFPWHVGAASVLYPGNPRQAANVMEVIDRFHPTILLNAPTGYASALAVEDFTSHYDLSSLRLCVSAAEALPAPLWHAWKERTGLDILDGIGSTENFHIFLSNRPGDICPGSSGKPVEGYELRIVDEDGAPVTTGEVGNLHVKGETAAHSYLRDSARSRESFLGAWLNTGDKYYEDKNGYFWHVGRSDDMLKVGGIWVSPVEVESTLIGHDAVLECAVVGVADDAGLIKPKAFVIAAPGVEPTTETAEMLVRHCTDSMSAYKRPRWIEFLDELPKTATGKIQRFRLR
jgi:benzoate-CoA ligase family protein